jgi:hypothetical protein
MGYGCLRRWRFLEGKARYTEYPTFLWTGGGKKPPDASKNKDYS